MVWLLESSRKKNESMVEKKKKGVDLSATSSQTYDFLVLAKHSKSAFDVGSRCYRCI